MEEKRQSTIRRNVNELFMRDGEIQESKLWANVYKGAGLWILVTYSEAVLKDWAVLTVLLVIGIAPDLLKKLITMKLQK